MVIYACPGANPLDAANVFSGFEVVSTSMGYARIRCRARYEGLVLPVTPDGLSMSSVALSYCDNQRRFYSYVTEMRSSECFAKRGVPDIVSDWYHLCSRDVVYTTVHPVLVPASPGRGCPLQYAWIEEGLAALVARRTVRRPGAEGTMGRFLKNGVAIPNMSGGWLGDLDARNVKWEILDGIYRNVLGPSSTPFYVFPPAGAKLAPGSTFEPSTLPDEYDAGYRVPVFTSDDGSAGE